MDQDNDMLHSLASADSCGIWLIFSLLVPIQQFRMVHRHSSNHYSRNLVIIMLINHSCALLIVQLIIEFA